MSVPNTRRWHTEDRQIRESLAKLNSASQSVTFDRPVAYFEVNVSRLRKSHRGKEYQHFFATAPRSIHDEQKLRDVVTDLRQRFPAPEFDISVTAYFEYGEKVSLNQIK